MSSNIEKIINYANNIDNINNYKSLSNDDKDFIEKIFSNKTFLTELGRLLDDIYSDGKLDSHDIPSIILFLITILRSYISSTTIEQINILDIVRYIIECIIFTLNTSLNFSSILLINKLIQSSLELLQFEFHKLNKKSFTCWCFKRKKRPILRGSKTI